MPLTFMHDALAKTKSRDIKRGQVRAHLLYGGIFSLTLYDGRRAYWARAWSGRGTTCGGGTLDFRATGTGAWRALTAGLVTLATIHYDWLRFGNTALEDIIA